jgi:hypothetical protein
VLVAAGATAGGLALDVTPAAAVGTPEISVGNTSITEGDAGTRIVRVMINLHQISPNGVTANWSTASGAATSGVDFKARTGKLYFKPGQVTRYAKVIVKPDATT